MSNPEAEECKNLGNEALKQNNFQEAVVQYTKAVNLDPKNKVYYSNRSNAYVQLQKYEEALKDATQTIELDPNWSRGYGRKGVALFFLGRYSLAAKAYEEGLKLEPGNESYKQELTRCTQFVFAEPFLRPDWAGALGSSQMTMRLMDDPKFVEKVQAVRSNPMSLQSLLNTDQEIQQAYIVLSGQEHEMRERQKREESRRLDEQLRRREESKRKEEEAIAKKRKEEFESLPPNKQQASLAKDAGNVAYKANDFQKALEHYTQAAQHDPTSAVYHSNMASAYMGLKNYEAAVASCDKAVEVGRENQSDYETIGKILFRKAKALCKLKVAIVCSNLALLTLYKRYHDAVKCYDAGLLDFRDPATVKLRNQAEERAKELDEQMYQDPEKAEAAKNEGNEFFKQENWADAVRCYSEAVRRNPKSAVYYSNRSVTYIKLREYALALTDAEKCVALDPSFVKGWVRKGMAHHMQKEYYKALEAYEKGMKIDPNYPELVEWSEKTTQAIQRMHTSGGKEEAEVARKRALADPQIQQLLKDGEVQNLMRTLQSGNRKAAEEMLMKSTSLYTKYDKLSKAGLI
jgi:stress-induced-phosphoprotein 1